MKFRITLKYVSEYVPNPEHYGNLTDPKDMLDLDIQNCKDDPLQFMDSDDVGVEVTGKILASDGNVPEKKDKA